MSDATVLIRDIAADASQKAANQVRPSEEQLSQIDAPAEENVWHEKPNLSKEEVKSRLKQKTVGFTWLVLDDAHILKPLQDKSSADSPPGGEGAEGTDDASVTPSEQSRRKKYANQTKEYLEEKIPKERREQAIWRLKKMVIEIQGHADCQYTTMAPC